MSDTAAYEDAAKMVLVRILEMQRGIDRPKNAQELYDMMEKLAHSIAAKAKGVKDGE